MFGEILASAVIGYFTGAIPFALVIGKVFYKTDIRNYGSGNLGGGNAGRVLGKKACVAVVLLDILKVTFAVYLATHFEHRDITTVVAGLSAGIGHCYTIFAKFKGGKAVAAMYGFWLAMVLFGSQSIWIVILPLLVYAVVLYTSKIVSLSGMTSAVINTIYIFFTADSMLLFAASLVFTVIVIYRHRQNIVRMMKNEENKITWI